MIVTFVSQCEKKALSKTRRVLDAFADRIGDNTWQTVITMEGLQTVKKMLRQTASKNTAVSCHQLKSRKRTELIWIVGNRDKFNEQGVVPVNSTKRDLLKTNWENDWKYQPLIKALVALSGLFHDLGKASKLFQEKLQPSSKNGTKGDPIRHEWISCVLLRSLIESTTDLDSDSDEVWLSALMEAKIDEKVIIDNAKKYVEKPLVNMPKTASLIAWLILSHHRLPVDYSSDYRGDKADSIEEVLSLINKKWGYENRRDEEEYNKRLNNCFEFPHGLGFTSKVWLKQVKKWAAKLFNCLPLAEQALEDGCWRQIVHCSRLCLMLGDHYYSSQENDKQWQDATGLYANTDRNTKQLKQKYDEHLVGVTKGALNIAHLLPAFEKEPPFAQDIQSLKKLSPNDFRWQDKAVKKIKEWKPINKGVTGFFIVNMASTGCGKTFANAKIMQALSKDQNSLRYILALGLRTLTLQTGDEYRDRTGLDNAELAVLIGSKAVQELHNQCKEDSEDLEFEGVGSESEELLLGEDVDFDCAIPDEGLATVLTQERDRKFLYAPVLACTIDHIMGATETKRGGKYILPFLRLMSSDLVIDEVDDFAGSDLIAIGRLIHLAGMLGRKVMISSATIPPDLAEGYFNAYKSGWKIFSAARNKNSSIGCAWVDEFNTEVISVTQIDNKAANEFYREMHSEFISKRVNKLKSQPARRKADIQYCNDILEEHEYSSEETIKEQYYNKIKQAIVNKHGYHHTTDDKTGVAVSFGVVRVANINPCVELTRYLLETDFPQDVEVKVMAYHSQQVLLLRHEQERHLDAVLKRKEKDGSQPAAFDNYVISDHLSSCSTKNLIFILVATPVEEVGRDHDFDWAVVEPSSYRSIIQLAGRVRRHRNAFIQKPNISLLQYNWKSLKNSDNPNIKCFCRPGYEEKLTLQTHDVAELLDVVAIENCVDAIPRIQKSKNSNYKNSLAGLEHYVTQSLLTNYERCGVDSLQGYLDEAWHLTAMPQLLQPFRKSEESLNLFLYFDPDREKLVFMEKDQYGELVNRENIYQISHTIINDNMTERLWLDRNYFRFIEEYSQKNEVSKRKVSLRYGELSFVYRENKEYEYCDQFGLVVKKS